MVDANITTLEQALEFLDQNSNISVQDLQTLVRQMQTNEGGLSTLLYNGKTVLSNGDEIFSWQIAESLGAQEGSIFKTFDQTDAGKLLKHDDFTLALNLAAGSPENSLIITQGLTNDISKNIAETAVGSVRTITGGTLNLNDVDINSAYFQKELPTLLRNTNVTDIDGYLRADLVNLYQNLSGKSISDPNLDFNALKQLQHDTIAQASLSKTLSGLSYEVDSNGHPLPGSGGKLNNVYTSAGFMEGTTGTPHAPASGANVSKFSEMTDMSHYADFGKATGIALDLLHKVGIGATLLGVYLTANEAQAAVEAGHPEKAAEIIAKFVGENVGGTVIGLGITALAAPLVAGTTGVAAVMGAVLVGGLSFAGGYFGGQASGEISAATMREVIKASKDLGIINNDIISNYDEAIEDPRDALSSLSSTQKAGLAPLLSSYGQDFLLGSGLSSGGTVVLPQELAANAGIPNIDVAKALPANSWLNDRAVAYGDGSLAYFLKNNDVIIYNYGPSLPDYVHVGRFKMTIETPDGHSSTGTFYDYVDQNGYVVHGTAVDSYFNFSTNFVGRFLTTAPASGGTEWLNGGAIIGNNYDGYMSTSVLNGNGYRNTIPSGIVTDFFRPGAGTLWDDFSNFLGLGTAANTVAQGLFNAGTIFLGFVAGGPIGAAISVMANIFAGAFSWTNLDPVVIDIDGDGIHLIQFEKSNALFDIDNDGLKESTGWVSPGDGILVRDLNNDGKINDISETFSEYYNDQTYADGLSALKTLDSNNDNFFTSADSAYSSLRIWQDIDGDGETDSGELKTLSALGITSINLNKKIETRYEIDGNAILSSTTATINGQTRDVVSANFTANPVGYEWNTVSNGIEIITEDNAGKILLLQNTTGSTINLSSLDVEAVHGNIGNDVLIGDADNNWIIGGAGNDSLIGGAGDDLLVIDYEDDLSEVDAGDGFDIVQVSGNESVNINLRDINAEVAIGGDGDDVLIGGSLSNVFIMGGNGDDFITGGAADDALSGEDGNDFIDGQRGDDVIRGHRGEDVLYGYDGEDYLDGGIDDDVLYGGAGEDLLIGGQGNDVMYGDAAYDVAQYTGDYDEYKITFLSGGKIQIQDKVAGRDGTDTLYDVEALNFRNITEVKLDNPSPRTVNDVIAVSGTGPYTISKSSLVANDVDFQSDTISVRAVLSAVGGAVSMSGSNIIFTPDPAYVGVRSFHYKIQDSQNHLGAKAYDPYYGTDEEMTGTVFLKEASHPNDPDFYEQWFLSEANILPVWKDYTGQGIKVGVFEEGVMDGKHVDLINNVTQATIDGTNYNEVSSHKTLVAGIIGASKNNVGGVGVAYDTLIADERMGDFDSPNYEDWFMDYNIFYDSNTGVTSYDPLNEFSSILNFQNYDIVNNSWRILSPFFGNFYWAEDYSEILLENEQEALNFSVPYEAAAKDGRDGLGTIIVSGAGNDRTSGDDTNLTNQTNNRFTITVGAINKVADLSSLEHQISAFSTPGSSVLISAPGSNITSTSTLVENANGSTYGNAYETVAGTSFATPVVSGIIALMLEANSNLGYRDVQEIITYTAQTVDDSNTTWQINGATNWNGGGLHYSHDYGYGGIDALAAVRLAETWNNQQVYANTQNKSYIATQSNLSITDNATTYATFVTPSADEILDIEHITVELAIVHTRLSDLVITLISPDGTEAKILNHAPIGDTHDLMGVNLTEEGILHYGFGNVTALNEKTTGTWTLKIQDTVSGETGTLKNWALHFYGSASSDDNTYIYTNEYTTLTDTSRRTLDDSNGDDTINLSAVTGNVSINLTAGSSSSIAGTAFTISSSTSIERLIAGDGNDTLTGNAQNNFIYGGRGNDTISGGNGNDWLVGTSGNDSLTGGSGTDKFVVRNGDVGTQTIADFNITDDLLILSGFETLHSKADLTISLSGSNTQIQLPNGQLLILNGINPSNLTDGHFLFKDGFYVNDAALSNEIYSGTNGNDTKTASGSNPYIMYGKSGNDTLTGGGGADTIYGDAGTDTLDGGLGGDTIYGGNDENYLYGGGGSDTLHLNDGLNHAFGGTGSDIFVVHKDLVDNGRIQITNGGISAFFNDVIDDFDLANDKIDLSNFSQLSQLSDLRLSSFNLNGTNYLRVYMGQNFTDQQITLKGISSSSLVNGHFIFADGESAVPVLPAPIKANSDSFSGQEDGSISFTVADIVTNDQSTALIGTPIYNKIINAPQHGALTYDGAGNFLYNPNQNYHGTDTATYEIKDIYGETATSIINFNIASVNDAPVANNNAWVTYKNSPITINVLSNDLDVDNDFLNVLSASHGSYGSVVINEDGTLTYTPSMNFMGLDSFTYSITDGNGGTSNTATINITVNNPDELFTATFVDNYFDGGSGIDTVTYANASAAVTINLAQTTVQTTGGSGSDILLNMENVVGSSYNDTLVGNTANNILYGGNGNDIIAGGVGNDTLEGGIGDDTYYFTSGTDAINETSGSDVLEIDVGVTDPGQVSFLRFTSALGDLTVHITNVAETEVLGDIKITGHFLHENYQVEQIRYAPGWGLADLTQTRVFTVSDTVMNDIIYGVDYYLSGSAAHEDDTFFGNITNDYIASGEGLDTIFAGDGDDIIYSEGDNDYIEAEDGNDILNGGTGNDWLDGGSGNDQLVGYTGDDTVIGGTGDDAYIYTSGLDLLFEEGGTDVLKITGSTTINDITVSDLNSLDTKVTMNSGVNEIQILYQRFHSDNAIEMISFEDGFYTTLTNYNSWNTGDGAGNTLNGTSGSDTIIGKSGADTLSGAAGIDYIHGGSDIDTIYGGAGDDVLHGGSEGDFLYGQDDADIIFGGAGGDWIEGGNGIDVIRGGDGDDSLLGQDGNDILYGDAGVDGFLGGNGADTFGFLQSSAFNAVDTIYDFNLTDGDKINIADVLQDYDPLSDLITDFVEITTSGSNSLLKIDVDGTAGGSNFVQIATIVGVTSLTDVSALETSGTLIA